MNKLNKTPVQKFKLYMIVAIGLIISTTVLAAGFFLNTFKSGNPFDINKLNENTFNPDNFFEIIRNPVLSKLPLINYAGIFILILVPVAGLVYMLVYYVMERNLKKIAITAGVIIILASSTVIGFLR